MRQFPPISEPDDLVDDQQYMTIKGQKYGCFWDDVPDFEPEINVKSSYTDYKHITTYCRPHQSYGWKIKSIKL